MPKKNQLQHTANVLSRIAALASTETARLRLLGQDHIPETITRAQVEHIINSPATRSLCLDNTKERLDLLGMLFPFNQDCPIRKERTCRKHRRAAR
jgi:hypothetical protein